MTKEELPYKIPTKLKEKYNNILKETLNYPKVSNLPLLKQQKKQHQESTLIPERKTCSIHISKKQKKKLKT